jgi:hypothetical protein
VRAHSQSTAADSRPSASHSYEIARLFGNTRRETPSFSYWTLTATPAVSPSESRPESSWTNLAVTSPQATGAGDARLASGGGVREVGVAVECMLLALGR